MIMAWEHNGKSFIDNKTKASYLRQRYRTVPEEQPDPPFVDDRANISWKWKDLSAGIRIQVMICLIPACIAALIAIIGIVVSL